jgi:uncharacterized membrane protein
VSRPRQPSSTGLDAHVAAALAYLAGPISGALVLMAERSNAYVRFHAWQAVIGLGGLGLLIALLIVIGFASLIFSATAFRVLLVISWAMWALWLVCWALCLYKAFTRRRWKLPIVGAYAERLAARPGATETS